MSNNLKTELQFDTEKIDPEHTKHLLGMLLSGILIAIVCVLGIVLVLLNAELIDKIKPEVQLIIFAVALAAFGIFRMIQWIREKL